MYSLRTSLICKSKQAFKNFPKYLQELNYSSFKHEKFLPRHVGSNDQTIEKMLNTLNLKV